MKKIFYITGVLISGLLAGCGAGKNPGYAYMPDMFYSVAYETYGPTAERLKTYGATYTGLPVTGTMAKGDNPAFIYPHKNDSIGYANSALVKNPLDTMGVAVNLKEAERLYLVNCAICHGTNLDGNGPLFNGGNGPYSAAPKNFLDPAVIALADGTMYHSITYGIRAMGSYASQLRPEERWMVISYIRSKQKSAAPAAAAADSTASKTGATPDSTATAKK